MQRRAVVRRYLRGWLLLDVAASFPLDLLFLGRRLDIWRLPRLLKIIRVLQYRTLTQAGKAVTQRKRTAHTTAQTLVWGLHSLPCLHCTQLYKAQQFLLPPIFQMPVSICVRVIASSHKPLPMLPCRHVCPSVASAEAWDDRLCRVPHPESKSHPFIVYAKY